CRVLASMLLLAKVPLRAANGVRPGLVQALLALANAGLVPLVPEHGSVGASGDLAAVSPIAMVLMGEGELLAADDQPRPAAGALAAAKLGRYRFAPKEGISF